MQSPCWGDAPGALITDAAVVIILGIIGWGLLIGFIATMILGGPERAREWGPMILGGLAGSFVGGTLGNLLTGDGLDLAASGFFGSIIGAVIVLGIYRAVRSRQSA